MNGEFPVVEHGDLTGDSWAAFDETHTYRYALGRKWDDRPPLVFLMLNPSTADAFKVDPTVRRCIGFARRDGFGGIVVVNLFALRATRPVHLTTHPDPVGPGNMDAIVGQCNGQTVVAAWGSHPFAVGRARSVMRAIMAISYVRCLGVTRDGHPRHPLYVKGDAPLTPWSAA